MHPACLPPMGTYGFYHATLVREGTRYARHLPYRDHDIDLVNFYAFYALGEHSLRSASPLPSPQTPYQIHKIRNC